MDIPKLLFKDYLNVPSNQPKAEWFDEGDEFNNYVIGDQVFVDNIPKEPIFKEQSLPEEYTGAICEKYEVDETGVLEKFTKLKLSQLSNNTWNCIVNNNNILKNAFQFNYDPSPLRKFNYLLFINALPKSRTDTTLNWIFNYKSGYITFYSNSPPPSTDNIEFTFVRYRGNIGLSNFTGGNVVNKIITGNALQYYIQMFDTTHFMNARTVGMNAMDLSSNKYILTYKDITLQNIELTTYGATSPITYDISAIILINTVPTTYDIGSFTVSPLENEFKIPVYDYPIDDVSLIAHFTCDGINRNNRNTLAKLLGGTFTSIDKKVGKSALMIPAGASATITDIDWNENNWTISFWYKLVNAYHDGNGVYIMYLHNPTNPSSYFKLKYDLSNNKFGFGIDDDIEIGDEINIFGEWTHIALSKNGNDYKLFVNNEEYLNREITLNRETYVMEFANYEPTISESAIYMNDIRIYYKSITSFDLDISPKSSLGILNAQITELNIPAKSIVFIKISKREPTYIDEVVELQLITKKNEKLDVGNKLVFEKAIDFLDEPNYAMNTGVNMEMMYNDELGNQGEVEFPFKSFHILDQTYQLKQLYITHYDTKDEPVQFDISISQVEQSEETKYINTITVEKMVHSRPQTTDICFNDDIIRQYTCDGTYHNLYKWMDVSAVEDGAQLMGGIFKRISSPVYSSSLYIPKGTGATITQFDWNILEWTFSFWYRQEHSTEKRRNMIFHFNDPTKIYGNPYGVYMMYDASNTELYIGKRDGDTFVDIGNHSIQMVDEWTHLAISKNNNEYRFYVNKKQVLSHTDTSKLEWGNYVVEFCNWVPSLLKSSGFLSNIQIYNKAVIPKYGIIESENTMAIKHIILPQSIELKKNTKIKVYVRPHSQRRGYIKVELIPDIPYNSSFSDTDGILKYGMIQKTLNDNEKRLDLISHPVNSKYKLSQPYFLTYKLKKINSFSIVKNNNLDTTYDLTLKYGSLSYTTQGKYEIKIANEFPLTSESISTTLNIGLGSGYSIASHPENVTDGLQMWFLCDGYIDNYISDVPTKLLGGIHTTTDYKVGKSSLMLNKGSGASITTYDWNIPEWTISFWFKYVSTTFIHEIPIIWFGSKSHNKEIEDGIQVLYDPSNNKAYVSTYKQVYGSITADLNEWSLITIMKNEDDYTLHIGENNITVIINDVEWDNNGNMLEFAQFEGGNINTACFIDDIRVYNRVLLDEDIGKLRTINNITSNAKCTYYTLKGSIVIPENSVIIVDAKRNNVSQILDMREEAYFQFYADDVTNDVIIDLLNNGVFYAQSGTETNPTYSFLENRRTGMYLSDGSGVGFSVNGENVMTIEKDNINIKTSITENGILLSNKYAQKEQLYTEMITITSNMEATVSNIIPITYVNGIIENTSKVELTIPDGNITNYVKSIDRSGLAYKQTEETLIKNLGSGLNGLVYSIAIDSESNVYVGGEFTQAGGQNINYIAKWDGSSWSSLGTVLNGHCLAIAIDSQDNVYAGGKFTQASGNNLNYIAKWDGSSWSSLGNGLDNDCLAIAIDSQDNVYAGGKFTQASGNNLNHIAKWNSSSWSSLGNGLSNSCLAITIDSQDNVYAGGTFTQAGGQNINHIAKWDGTKWISLGGGLENTCLTIAIDSQNNIYAGGDFRVIQSVGHNRIAMWNGSSWSSLGTGLDNDCLAIAIDSQDNVYVGGEFTQANGTDINRIAKWDGITWSSLGDGLNNFCFEIAIDNQDNIYAGGNFTTVNGENIDRIVLYPSINNIPVVNLFGKIRDNNINISSTSIEDKIKLYWDTSCWIIIPDSNKQILEINRLKMQLKILTQRVNQLYTIG